MLGRKYRKPQKKVAWVSIRKMSFGGQNIDIGLKNHFSMAFHVDTKWSHTFNYVSMCKIYDVVMPSLSSQLQEIVF